MARVIAPGFEALDIPVWVVDLPSFVMWARCAVFDQSFRSVRSPERHGIARYTLEHR